MDICNRSSSRLMDNGVWGMRVASADERCDVHNRDNVPKHVPTIPTPMNTIFQAGINHITRSRLGYLSGY